MVTFGMNLLLWTDACTAAKWNPLFSRLAGLGFDSVDIPVMKSSPRALQGLGGRLAELGLERTAVTVLGPGQHLCSDDAAERARAVDALKRSIEGARALGSRLLSGPIYGALGVFSGKPATRREWAAAVTGLRAAAEFAADAGVTLALEYLNRFEMYLVTSAAEAKKLVTDVDHPNLRLMIDTFHAHIEEKDPSRAIREIAPLLVHVQASENDRSTPGAGQVAWESILGTLAEIGYEGSITIEAFGQGLPSLAAATRIWRPMFKSEEAVARDGLAFLKKSWARIASSRRDRRSDGGRRR